MAAKSQWQWLIFRSFLMLLLISTQPLSAQGQNIDPLSVISLEVQILHDDLQIGTATGFVVEKNGKHYLLTNRHVGSCVSPRPKAHKCWRVDLRK